MANLDIIRGRQVVIPLINRTGADSIPGDVVVLDSANDESYVTTTTVATTDIVGVVQEDIVSLGTGRVLIAGYAPLVKVGAAVTRGDFAETSAVATEAGSSATRHTGSFGQWLKAGALPSAVLWGLADNTVPPPASALTVEELDGTPTDPAITTLVFPNGTLGIAAGVATYTPAAAATKSLSFLIDGGGSVITAGVKGFFQLPVAHTFTAWRLLGDPSGSMVVDLWRGSYADHVAGTIAVGDSICAANKPTLSGVRANEDTSITDWIEAGSVGDVYWVSVDATPATVTKATLVLEYT